MGHLLPASGKQATKAEALAAAGISTSTAHRYEDLIGGTEAVAREACAVGAERFFTATRQSGDVPTMAGLKAALQEAVEEVLGPPPEQMPTPP